MITSTGAFLVSALAVPTTPYLTGAAGKVVAAFGAVLVSTNLTLLEPIFEPSRASSIDWETTPDPLLYRDDSKIKSLDIETESGRKVQDAASSKSPRVKPDDPRRKAIPDRPRRDASCCSDRVSAARHLTRRRLDVCH
jgi:hypothetical protein